MSGMKKNMYHMLSICLFMLLSVIALSGCASPRTERPTEGTRLVTGDDGVEVRIPVKPTRVMTISAAYDTILLGTMDTSRFSSVNSLVKYEGYSLEWEKAARIKTQNSTYPLERIIRIKPDIVIATDYTTKDTVEALRGVGIPVVVVEMGRTVEGVISNVERLAELVGEEETGRRHAEAIRGQIEALNLAVKDIPAAARKRILFVSSMDGYTGTNSLFDDMCRYMGIDNAPSASGYPPRTSFTDERVIEMNPDFIFIPSYGGMDKGLADRFLNTPAFSHMKVMRDGHVLPLKAAYLYTGNHHIGEAMTEIAKVVYPQYVK